MAIIIEKNEITEGLNKLIRAHSNFEPAFSDIAESMLFSTKERFAKSEAPDGSKWQANSSLTLKKKKGNKPLIDSKLLADTIAVDSNSKGAEIFSPQEYAATQQFGAKKGQYTKQGKRATPWGDVPARPFLGASKKDISNILKIIKEHLEQSI